ncbi:MAG: hemin ABC transporter substrate-binding protein [Desertimonas sp.]
MNRVGVLATTALTTATALVISTFAAADTALLVTTASTGPDATSTTAVAATMPPVATDYVVTDDRGVEVDIASAERLIPLDGDIAEIIFALGLGDLVVATDLSATYPPEADALPQIGYQRALSAEPIIDFEPTLLLATDVAGPPETLTDLEAVGIPLVMIPTSPDATGAADKIVAVAEAVGVPERGATLAAEVQAQIDAAVERRDETGEPLRIVTIYLRGADTQVVLGEDYSTHWLIEAAGAIDVATELGITESVSVTGEALIRAAPDVLLVTEDGLASVGGRDGLLEAIPALARTPAGETGAILAYDAQLMLGNGPRTGEFLDTLIDDLAMIADGGSAASGSAATTSEPS